jgi:hypothetical protein
LEKDKAARVEKQGFASSTKMDFMNLRNKSTLKVSLVDVSIENI